MVYNRPIRPMLKSIHICIVVVAQIRQHGVGDLELNFGTVAPRVMDGRFKGQVDDRMIVITRPNG